MQRCLSISGSLAIFERMNNYFIFFDIIIKADENYLLDPSDLVISFF